MTLDMEEVCIIDCATLSLPRGSVPVTTTAHDPLSFRQAVLNLLEVEPPQQERLLAELERKREKSQPLYSTIIYILTHLMFPENEAQRHWTKIRAHRDATRETLGRDVG